LGPIPQFEAAASPAGSLTAYLISIAVMSCTVFRTVARGSKNLRTADSRGDVLHTEVGAISASRRCIGADHQHLHPHAGDFGTEILAVYGMARGSNSC